MAVIDYRTKMDAIYDMLNNANVTAASYPLFTNMDKPIQSIVKGNPARIPKQVTQYPCVYIHLNSKDTEFSDINRASGKYRAKISWDLIALVYKAPGSDDSDEQVHYLAENIEEIVRRNVRISALSDNLTNYVNTVEFDSIYNEGIYLSAARVNLVTEHLY